MRDSLQLLVIRKLLACRGVRFCLMIAVLVAMGISPARAQIYGSGDFILNDGPVVSDTDNQIGGTLVLGGSNETLALLTGGGGTGGLAFIPASNDKLPHSINASAVNGTVQKFPDQALYDFDTPVSLRATPDPGFVFEKWTLDRVKMGLGGSAPTQYTVVYLNSPTILFRAVFNYELVAHFIPATRIVSVSAVDLSWDQQAVGGSSHGSFKIKNSGNAPLTVTSIDYPAGFNGNWEGTIAPGSSQEISVSFAPAAAGTFSGNITVNSDATAGAFTLPVTAVAQDAWTLTGTSLFGAQKTSPVTRTYWHGSTVTLRAMPVDGYIFKNWTEAGKTLSSSANFDLPMTGAHEVRANYLPISRTLSVTISPSSQLKKRGAIYRGTISVKNTGTVPVQLTDLLLQGKGTGRITANGLSSGWIDPGTALKMKISFTPSWLKFSRLRVLAVAEDLTSPVAWAELKR